MGDGLGSCLADSSRHWPLGARMPVHLFSVFAQSSLTVIIADYIVHVFGRKRARFLQVLTARLFRVRSSYSIRPFCHTCDLDTTIL